MAVINSLGIGNAAKSAGNITYAHYRGRTIAKQRITQNKSNTRLQQEQRTTFAAVEKICRGFNGILSLFSNTKYGYKLNRFVKLNYDVIAQYVKSTDEWDDRGTPVGDAQAYIETYFAGASKNYIAKKLNIYTSFDLRRNFRISVDNEASGPLTIRFSDAGHVYKNVVARFVSVFPSTLLTPVIDVPLTFGTNSNQQVTTGDLNMSAQLTSDFEELIISHTVLDEVIEQIDYEGLTFGSLKNKITVTNRTDTRILQITVTDPDPLMAKAIVDKVIEISSEKIKSIMDIEAVNLVDEGTLNSTPVSPSYKKNVLIIKHS